MAVLSNINNNNTNTNTNTNDISNELLETKRELDIQLVENEKLAVEHRTLIQKFEKLRETSVKLEAEKRSMADELDVAR